jgi:mono/diheme cytochrome c family protein
MPASEKTSYNMKVLHRVFAVTSVALLAITVWMILADHGRPWRQHQRDFQHVERSRVAWDLKEQPGERDIDPDRRRLEAKLRQLNPTWFTGEFPWLGAKWLRLPILDAFAATEKIEQVWLPELTQDYHHRQVDRFDRCITCHRAIDQTRPGAPDQQRFPRRHGVTLELATPTARPEQAGDESENDSPAAVKQDVESTDDLLLAAYGFAVSPSGLLPGDGVSVRAVRPDSAASGAVVISSGIRQNSAASEFSRIPLREDTETWTGAEVRRRVAEGGLVAGPPPAPGLRVGDVLRQIDDTPVRTMDDVRRLLCDEAAWGSPVTLVVDRGLPQPFASHPRPDLFVGASSPHPLQKVGCTICHAGQGSATDFSWASHTPNTTSAEDAWREDHAWFSNPHWETPMLPQRFAESSCLRCHHDVVDLEPSERFPDPPAPKVLAGFRLVRKFGCFGCHEINGYDTSGRRIGPDLRWETHRKVGPSLRQVAQKLDEQTLVRWIGNPQGLRHDAQMPRFFGLWDHLHGSALKMSQRLEPVELAGIATYLLDQSRPANRLTPPDRADDSAKSAAIERGREAFELSGCLACHQHRDFPAAKSTHGPDISNVAAVLNPDTARTWLYKWVRHPQRHDAGTTMPDMLLKPTTDARGKTIDAAADITDYLLSRTAEPDSPAERSLLPVTEGTAGKSARPTATAPPHTPSPANITELLKLNLAATFPDEELAQQYAEAGIPHDVARGLTGPEQALTAPLTEKKKLLYVGRKAIAVHGCSGCHDIPGFEQAKRIGTALTDWGRKKETLLDFGRVSEYLESPSPSPEELDPYFVRAIRRHGRIGFLAQKVREPRTFDYQLADTKKYYTRLRMPQFSFDPTEREQIMTFVLGLVAQPPAPQYVHQPDEAQRALQQGRDLLGQYNCGGCHLISPQRWKIAFRSGEIPAQSAPPTFPFVEMSPTQEQLATSATPDTQGRLDATIVGLPHPYPADGLPWVLNEDEDPLEDDEDYEPDTLFYLFDLWNNAVLDGNVHRPGVVPLLLTRSMIQEQYAPNGGDVGRLLTPTAVDYVKQDNPALTGAQARAWLPPPLMLEGRRVQSQWLHDYLLDPAPIRPAVLMRMPRFPLRGDETQRLVAYFASVDGAEQPLNKIAQRQEAYLTAARERYRRRLAELSDEAEAPLEGDHLDDAMRFLIDEGYCVKCHLIGDFSPGASPQMLAPNLADVYRRLRPDYVRRWIADPRHVLPYTTMPAYIPYQEDAPHLGGVSQDLYHGTSIEQLDALVDLLMNFDRHSVTRSPITPLVEAAKVPADESPAEPQPD